MISLDAEIIDEEAIARVLDRTHEPAPGRVREILSKARVLHGLALDEVADLIATTGPELFEEIAAAARWVKQEIYGNRIVLFAPLYISNHCSNSCLYCGYRRENTALTRRSLSQVEIAEEVRFLVSHGHKRLLLLAGELPGSAHLSYVLDAIETVYATRLDRGEIRRVNVNIAPLTVEEFARLKAARIGTYQLFQETYHRPTYASLHPRGPKADYAWRLTAMHRAMQAGIDDVGIGPLLGLYDWRFEVLALLQHIRHLETTFGVGPHTISVPRLEPAVGSAFATSAPSRVSDQDFLKLVAILRLAVPYTGLIMSTREPVEIRRRTFALGVSQISAGSRVDPGGYTDGPGDPTKAQFQLGDHRSINEVIHDLAASGYLPSFCTACYRLGRTGQDFMDLAKPGAIKAHCAPNALTSFLEYLEDYAPPATRDAGEAVFTRALAEMEAAPRARAVRMLARIRAGERDIYV